MRILSLSSAEAVLLMVLLMVVLNELVLLFKVWVLLLKEFLLLEELLLSPRRDCDISLFRCLERCRFEEDSEDGFLSTVREIDGVLEAGEKRGRSYCCCFGERPVQSACQESQMYWCTCVTKVLAKSDRVMGQECHKFTTLYAFLSLNER